MLAVELVSSSTLEEALVAGSLTPATTPPWWRTCSRPSPRGAVAVSAAVSLTAAGVNARPAAALVDAGDLARRRTSSRWWRRLHPLPAEMLLIAAAPRSYERGRLFDNDELHAHRRRLSLPRPRSSTPATSLAAAPRLAGGDGLNPSPPGCSSSPPRRGSASAAASSFGDDELHAHRHCVVLVFSSGAKLCKHNSN